jgi:hypothetical protein
MTLMPLISKKEEEKLNTPGNFISSTDNQVSVGDMTYFPT